nr:hypothetical protein CFP56_15085 [Quercus suber]
MVQLVKGKISSTMEAMATGFHNLVLIILCEQLLSYLSVLKDNAGSTFGLSPAQQVATVMTATAEDPSSNTFVNNFSEEASRFKSLGDLQSKTDQPVRAVLAVDTRELEIKDVIVEWLAVCLAKDDHHKDNLLEIPKESITLISLNTSTSSSTRVSRQRALKLGERKALEKKSLKMEE